MSQQVTGMTAFWAVLALALNAMARPSFTSQMLYGDDSTVERSLIPQLSSPVLCIVDCVFDLVLLLKMLSRAARKTVPEPGPILSTRETSRDPIAVRLLLFVLGGLPQAIKVFGMRGVPYTQAICSVFLASTVLAALTESMRERADVDRKELASWVRASLPIDLVRNLVFGLHVAATVTIWNAVAKNVYLSRDHTNANFTNLCQWIDMLIKALTLLATLLWIISAHFAPRFTFRSLRLRTSPFVACMPLWMLFSYPERMLKVGDRIAAGEQVSTTFIDVVWSTAPLLLVASVGSYALSAFFVRITKWLRRTDPKNEPSPSEQETRPEDTNPPTTAEDIIPVRTSATDVHSNPDPVQIVHRHASSTLLLPFNDNLQTLRTSLTAKGIRPPATLGTWALVASSFLNFRRAVFPALAHQWEQSLGQVHQRAYKCLPLLWQIVKLFVLQMVLFVVLAMMKAYDFSVYEDWYRCVARRAGPGVGWVFFAVFNLVTAVIYYAVAFDGSGTVNPGWTGVLGRKV